MSAPPLPGLGRLRAPRCVRSVARPDAVVAALGVPRRRCSADRCPRGAAFAIAHQRHALGLPRSTARAVGGSHIFGMMIWLLSIRFIVPVLGVFYGTSLIADEVDDKTITYLFTRPIPRSAVLLGKSLRVPRVHGAAGAAVGDAGLSSSSCRSAAAASPPRFRSLRGRSRDAGRRSCCVRRGVRSGRHQASSGRWSWVWSSRSAGSRPCCCSLATSSGLTDAAYYLQALVTHEMPQDSAVSLLLHGLPRGAVRRTSLLVPRGHRRR